MAAEHAAGLGSLRNGGDSQQGEGEREGEGDNEFADHRPPPRDMILLPRSLGVERCSTAVSSSYGRSSPT